MIPRASWTIYNTYDTRWLRIGITGQVDLSGAAERTLLLYLSLMTVRTLPVTKANSIPQTSPLVTGDLDVYNW